LSSRTLNVVTAVGLVALLAGLSLTAPIWSRMLRQPIAGAEPDGAASPSPVATPASSPEARRTIKVKLYFEATDRPGLMAEEREVLYSDDISRQLRTVVEALLAGPAGGARTLPPDARVLDVFVTAQGTAYVDLSAEIRRASASAPSPAASPAASPVAPPAAPSPVAASSHAELMAVYGIVDTLAVNFPAVKQVHLLIDGQPARSFWGHVDIARPLRPDLSLLAGSDTVPGGGPWAEPAAPTAPSAPPAPSPSRAPAATP
jgi:hypothetical protein